MKKHFLKILVSLISASGLTIFIQSPKSFAVNSVEERNREIHELTPDQKRFELDLAKAYAPEVFQDSDIKREKDASGNEVLIMSSHDALTDPLYDGDENIQNNADHAKPVVDPKTGETHLAHEMRASVGWLVEETDTDFYPLYEAYHVVDDNAHHDNDSENLAVFSIRDPNNLEDFGTFHKAYVNRHGYALWYSADPQVQKKIRNTYEKNIKLKEEYKRAIAFGGEFVLDGVNFAPNHETTGAPEFLKGPKGEVRGLKIFSCRSSHAMTKCNENLWNQGDGEGYIYACALDDKGGMIPCFPMSPTPHMIRYKLFSIEDEILDKFYPTDFESRSDADKKALLEKQKLIGSETKMNTDAQQDVADGIVRVRPELPRDYVKGKKDKESGANMIWNHGMKMKAVSAFMHIQDQDSEPDLKDKISSHYIHNKTIEYVKLK